MLIKISSAVLAAVGAKTADEFPDALAKLLTDTRSAADTASNAVTDLQSSLTTATQAAADLKSKLEAAYKKIGDLESTLGNPATITEAKVKEWATEAGKIEGYRAATEAVGAIGKGAPPAAPSSAAGAGKSNVEQLIAAGKLGEAYDADENIRAEFPTKESYAAYMKNQHRVHVKGGKR